MEAARRKFAHWPAFARDDVLQEVAGLSWLNFVRQLSAGVEPLHAVGVLIRHTLRDAGRGVRLAGMESNRDALSRRRRARGEGPEAVNAGEAGWVLGSGDHVEAANLDLDFEAWCETLSEEHRRLMEHARWFGWRDAAKEFHLSKTEAEQLPEILWESWWRFCRR
jgi:hypothetical protein